MSLKEYHGILAEYNTDGRFQEHINLIERFWNFAERVLNYGKAG